MVIDKNTDKLVINENLIRTFTGEIFSTQKLRIKKYLNSFQM